MIYAWKLMFNMTAAGLQDHDSYDTFRFAILYQMTKDNRWLDSYSVMFSSSWSQTLNADLITSLLRLVSEPRSGLSLPERLPRC